MFTKAQWKQSHDGTWSTKFSAFVLFLYAKVLGNYADDNNLYAIANDKGETKRAVVKDLQIVIDRFHVNYDFKYSRMSFQQFFESRGLGGMCIRGGLFKGGALLEFRNLIGALIWFRHVQYINNIQFDFAGL